MVPQPLPGVLVCRLFYWPDYRCFWHFDARTCHFSNGQPQRKHRNRFGNIIGSNISNTLLILGVSSIITPLLVKKTTISKEIPLSLLAVVAVFALVNDELIDGNGYSLLTRIDGVVLILFFAIFLFYTFGISREKEGIIEKAVDDLANPKKEKMWYAILMILGGLAGLTLGGRWIVSSALSIAADLE